LANDTTVCANSILQLNAPAGYNYSWSPSQGLNNASIANPTATISNNITYFLTITDASGCAGTDSITINSNPLPVLDLGSNQAFCENSNVQLNAPAGYAYNWLPAAGLNNSTIANPVATITGNIDYVLTITDSFGCTATDSISITAYPLPQISFVSDTAVCENACVTLLPIVAGNLQISWSPAATLNDSTIFNPTACPTTNTSYTAIVTDNNQCTASSNINVNVNALPNTPTVTFDGTTLTSTTADTYQWYEGSNMIIGATNMNYVPLANGDYMVEVTNAFGCSATSIPFAVNINGFVHQTNHTGVFISPNPVFDALRITLNTNEEFAHVIIFNAAGAKVYNNKTILNNSLEVDTKTFSAGVYTVSVQSTSGIYHQRVSVIK
jgi:hypothetical protein